MILRFRTLNGSSICQCEMVLCSCMSSGLTFHSKSVGHLICPYRGNPVLSFTQILGRFKDGRCSNQLPRNSKYLQYLYQLSDKITLKSCKSVNQLGSIQRFIDHIWWAGMLAKAWNTSPQRAQSLASPLHLLQSIKICQKTIQNLAFLMMYLCTVPKLHRKFLFLPYPVS